MTFPEKNSAAWQVCSYIADFGPVTAVQVKEVTGHSPNTVLRAFTDGYLDRTMRGKWAYAYTVKPHVSARLLRSDYAGEIAPPRSVNVLNTPELKDYFKAIKRNLREPIRDMSFLRSSAQFLNKQ